VKRPEIVTRDQWLKARKALLAREKEFDQERDRLTEARRKLPMVRIGKEYVFDGPQGAVTLCDLFEGRRQPIVYHFMFYPDRNAGCKHCSCVMDNIAGSLVHLTGRDTSFAVISRAPIAKIEEFKIRMQWTFPWVSSFRNEFNYDYHVTLDPDRASTGHNYREFDFRGELPVLSVFFRDNDLIVHSYSTTFVGWTCSFRCTTSSIGLRWVVRRTKGTAWWPAKPLGSATTTSMGHHFSVNNLTLTTVYG
jgi:predicted dithiol-disulfide oxidoreductase (DUF899 family)